MDLLRLGALASACTYLAWRVAFTWSGAHPGLFVALLLAEVFGVARLWVELRTLDDERVLQRDPDEADARSTAVFVVIDDEPASEVRTSLVTAAGVRGATAVVAVDRTDRHDVAALCDRLTVRRVTDPSGNGDVGRLLTEALRTTDSSLVAVLPASVAALPDLVTVTAPAFDDPETAVVVARVETANARSSIDEGGYGSAAVRQRLVTPRLDDAHALPWWPGPAVARRDALVEIGGFADGRLGSTLATGVRLQVGGWRMADVPIVAARRLATWTEQRHLHDWARDLHERLELKRRRDISWSSTRLTAEMRTAYASALVPALAGMQRALLFLVLLATATGVGLPLVAPGAVFAGAWGTRMLLGLAARHRASRDLGFLPWITLDLRLGATSTVVAWHALRRAPLLAELVDPAPGQRVRRPLITAVQVVLAILLTVHGVGLVAAPHGELAMIMILLAAGWLLVASVHAREGLGDRQRRTGFRADTRTEVEDAATEMTVSSVSPLGIGVTSHDAMWVGTAHRLAFSIPTFDRCHHQFEVTTVVRNSIPVDDGFSSFLRFAQISDGDTDRLVEFCVAVAGAHHLRGHEHEVPDGPDGLEVRIVDGQRPSSTTTSPTSTSSPDDEAPNRRSEVSMGGTDNPSTSTPSVPS